MIDTDALATLIHDAQQVPLPAQAGRPRAVDLSAVDLTAPSLVIPDATVSLLEDYELYLS
jgi:hypothetical protein